MIVCGAILDLESIAEGRETIIRPLIIIRVHRDPSVVSRQSCTGAR